MLKSSFACLDLAVCMTPRPPLRSVNARETEVTGCGGVWPHVMVPTAETLYAICTEIKEVLCKQRLTLWLAVHYCGRKVGSYIVIRESYLVAFMFGATSAHPDLLARVSLGKPRVIEGKPGVGRWGAGCSAVLE